MDSGNILAARQNKNRTEIKICGLTRVQEAAYLNAAEADYAGFVFYPPSRRNVTIEQAGRVMERLSPKIRKVAVTVAADRKQVTELQGAGFDILQIHKQLRQETLEAAELPVWYAINLADRAAFLQKAAEAMALPESLRCKITGIVVDGASYGGGKTFDWSERQLLHHPIFEGRDFILAGGLNVSNVREGIELLGPDIVDVSSGVEGADGKDGTLVERFVSEVIASAGNKKE